MNKKKRLDLPILHQEQVLLQTLGEAIPIPIFYKGLNLKYLGCNKAFEKFFGKKRNEIVGKTVFDLYSFAPLKAEKTQQADLEFLNSAKNHYIYESDVPDLEGKERHFIITAAKFYKSDGNPGGIVSVMFDNTERKLFEKALQEKQSFLQTLIDSIPSPVFYKNAQQQYLGYNKAFETYSGVKLEDALGKQVFAVFPSKRGEEIHRRETKFLESPHDQIIFESKQISASLHEARDFVISKAKFRNPDGSLGGIIAVMFDITERKLLEKNLLQTNQQLMEKNAQITESIEYASHIQTNIFPDPTEIVDHFKEGFILFRPKDIVSGDFYWFAQKDDLLLIAAADCTGHGVPGALMTVLGNSLLNQLVNEQNLTRPDHILFALDLKLTAFLQKRNPKSKIYEGIELALCAIDLKKKTLQFAGAKSPFYHMRDGHLEQIDGSRWTIGGRSITQKKSFKLHEIALQGDDVFYIFTDGFRDQLGDQQKGKFKTCAFREYLTQIHQFPLKKQKKSLEEIFEKWKGTNIQTDDILVMGFKI